MVSIAADKTSLEGQSSRSQRPTGLRASELQMKSLANLEVPRRPSVSTNGVVLECIIFVVRIEVK